MTKIFPSQTNNGQDKFSTKVLDNNLNLEASSTSSSSEQIELTQAKVPLAVPKSSTEESNFEPKNAKRESIFRRLQAQTIAVLVGSVVMLPILAVGTGTYYFGNLAVNKQIVLAKRGNNLDLLETELARQQKLLAALLIGTGTSAWLVGTIAAFMTKRLLDEMSQSASDTVAKTSETSNIYIESALQPNILEAIVEEVRTYLNCDRVAVYSLNQDNYGVIVAESVATGYTKGLGKTIEDPCFEIKYRNKYRNGISAMQNTSLAIADIDKASMTNRHKEQLEQLQVKANLVTSIVNENRLFGLLVAHQCSAPREWRQGEIEFLRQLAKRAALAIENAKLLEDLASLGRKTETERKWTHYFTDAVRYIRQSIEQEDILEISVEEVQRALTCDRVVVYSLNQDNYGVVIAESVSAGYPKALNKVIEDPCFEARYLDKYRDGRVRAIDNIYEAGMSRCYIEQLETLQVKANLVTPILNEGKLFGLLVAHQCSDPRHWQDYEIRWMTQIATQVGFALDNATLLEKLKNDDLPTQLLNNFSSSLSEKIPRAELLEIAVEQIQEIIKLDRVIIYQFDDDGGNVVAESVVCGYPQGANFQLKNFDFATEYSKSYWSKAKAIANIDRANLTDSHREKLKILEVKASLTVPIWQDGQIFALLIGHQCQQPRIWLQSEIDLFTQLALQLGLVLDRLKLQELDLNKNTPINGVRQNGIEPYTQDEHHTEQKAIAAMDIEVLDLPQQNHYPTVNLIDNIPENNYYPSTIIKPLKLSTTDITVEAKEIASEPVLIAGQLVKTNLDNNVILVDQFVGEITNLSERITQQSLFVTESFQKLAAFAKELSEKNNSRN